MPLLTSPAALLLHPPRALAEMRKEMAEGLSAMSLRVKFDLLHDETPQVCRALYIRGEGHRDRTAAWQNDVVGCMPCAAAGPISMSMKITASRLTFWFHRGPSHPFSLSTSVSHADPPASFTRPPWSTSLCRKACPQLLSPLPSLQEGMLTAPVSPSLPADRHAHGLHEAGGASHGQEPGEAR